MERLVLILVVCCLLASCTTTYYVVRHAEKAAPSPSASMMTSDPALSSKGELRALALKTVLEDKKISYIFSTNTIRTTSTAAPFAISAHLKTNIYSQVDSAFINKLKRLKKNTLIVGHSNTVDDIVNRLTGRQDVRGDLQDSVYNRLFVIKSKRGQMKFESRTYGGF